MVLVNGQVQSQDMYFYDITRCSFFANEIVRSKREARGVAHNSIVLAAYCLPRVADPKKVRVY